MKYVHTNLVARDWKQLADFYIKVFDCRPVYPERDLSGNWLERATNVENASIRGIHLLLPGWGDDGPTLEIFQYGENVNKSSPAANREGYGHIAFSVRDVEPALRKVLINGGRRLGDIVSKKFDHRTLTFIYVQDPEGNIIELQSWD